MTRGPECYLNVRLKNLSHVEANYDLVGIEGRGNRTGQVGRTVVVNASPLEPFRSELAIAERCAGRGWRVQSDNLNGASAGGPSSSSSVWWWQRDQAGANPLYEIYNFPKKLWREKAVYWNGAWHVLH